MLKKTMLFLFLLLIILAIIYRDSITYGFQQGVGQAKILTNAVAIEDVINSNTLEDSLKKKILFIQKVKTFAEEELGLKETSNYTTFYDQDDRPILWVVTASPEFKIEAYQWAFPIVGNFSYKGFFDYEKAIIESNSLKVKGYDTEIDEVNAWSTLGWFKDPILSSMLKRSKPSLTDLIIHELTHSTIYLKDSIALNENLASFIAKKGTELFFSKNPELSPLYENYQMKKAIGNSYRSKMKIYIKNLNKLYNSFNQQMTYESKLAMKEKLMKAIKLDILKNRYSDKEYLIQEKMKSFKINNAFFSGFNTYRSKQNSFEKEFYEKFNGNLKAFIQYYKEKN